MKCDSHEPGALTTRPRCRIFRVRRSIPIMNKSMLNGHPCRIPHLTEIESERELLRLSLAERLERKI